MARISGILLCVLVILCPAVLFAGMAEDAGQLPAQMGVQNRGTASHPAYYVGYPAHGNYAGPLQDFIDQYGGAGTPTFTSTWVDDNGKRRTIRIGIATPGSDISIVGKGKGEITVAVGGIGASGATAPDGTGGKGQNGGNAKVWVSESGCGIAKGGDGGTGGNGRDNFFGIGGPGGDGGKGGNAEVEATAMEGNVSGNALSGKGGDGGRGGNGEIGGPGGNGGDSGEARVLLLNSFVKTNRKKDFGTMGEATSNLPGKGGPGGNGGMSGGSGGNSGAANLADAMAFVAYAIVMGGQNIAGGAGGGASPGPGGFPPATGGQGGDGRSSYFAMANGGAGWLYSGTQEGNIASGSFAEGGKGCDGGKGGDITLPVQAGNGGNGGNGSDAHARSASQSRRAQYGQLGIRGAKGEPNGSPGQDGNIGTAYYF